MISLKENCPMSNLERSLLLDLDIAKIKQLENDDWDYERVDIEKACLVKLFCESGFSEDDIKEYFLTGVNEGFNSAAKIKMLKKQRGKLLDIIHIKQNLLDKLDYLIASLKESK